MKPLMVYGAAVLLLLGLGAALCGQQTVGARPGTEVWWCERLAQKYGAEVEVRLPDESRVDLLTPEYAIEVDWANKWAEGIGQALYYGLVTERKPAVLLLTRDRDDKLYVVRCQVVCAKYGIKLLVEPTHGAP